MDSYFLLMLKNLRQNEEILLYANILAIDESDSNNALDFLENEYKKESIGFPYTAPTFNKESALWAAKAIYIAAQLMLYRENKSVELSKLLPDYNGEINASSILSADLCFRFLPDIIMQLKIIDADDALISILENYVAKWHYSGINYKLEVHQLDFSNITSNQCLQQLYINRIIEHKNILLAKHPACITLVKASLGNFEQEFWSDFKIATNINE